ncbi:MAG: DEAD/DEAH box helicase, partial [Caryophanon sp.]|nr:DEAD/DEAH box helicase [Caryophanon sp.]
QNIKSNNTGRSRAIRAMQSNFRLAMTGTPVENTLEELWTIMDFVEPGALGALAHFKEQYIKNEDYDGLKQLLQKYYLRRTKDEVLKEHLPQKHLLPPTFVQASPKQVDLSKSMLQSVQAKTSNSLTIINHLRALYAHTNALNGCETIDDTPQKFEAVMKLLDEIYQKDEKVLIFTDLKKVQQLLKHRISQQFGISVPIINGETPNRPEAVRQFNEQNGFGVMILSPRAAGVGLTITSANHVVHYTRWWNPAVENQATDRAYRIGQTKDVYVYQIITQDAANFPNGTVEEVMHQLLQDKSYLAENVIVPFDTKNLQQQVLHHLNASSPVR